MKDWFNSLAPRERTMVSVAAVVILLALGYVAAWNPLSSRVARLEKSVEERQAVKQWMEQAAVEANQLRSTAGAGGGDEHRSLLAVVDQTAKQSQLAPAVKRIEPEGQELVRVSLERASFDDLVLWLGSLQRTFGVRVADISIERQAETGRVNARLTLKRFGQ
jgi:general secretion pathway protein M